MPGDVMEYVTKYSTTTILIGGTYYVLYLFMCMPRDLPTRRVFLSRSHFVSFIPLVLLRVVSDPEVEEVETLYHAVFFTLGPTTLFMSHSFR